MRRSMANGRKKGDGGTKLEIIRESTNKLCKKEEFEKVYDT
jgi:hypothetical protein